MTLQGTMIRRTASDGAEIDCYHVKPTGQRRGGVIVIMEAFGLNNHIKTVCDDYAAEGYEVIAPALYDRIERDFQSGYDPKNFTRIMPLMQRNGFDNPILDVRMCIAFLRDQKAGKIGIVGYCYGGAIAWLAAARCEGLSAASDYYGTGTLQFVDVKPQCPVIIHFGKKDQSTPPDKVDALAKAHPDVPIFWYDAGHGFNCDERADYDAASAKTARDRTLAFFGEHIG